MEEVGDYEAVRKLINVLPPIERHTRRSLSIGWSWMWEVDFRHSTLRLLSEWVHEETSREALSLPELPPGHRWKICCTKPYPARRYDIAASIPIYTPNSPPKSRKIIPTLSTLMLNALPDAWVHATHQREWLLKREMAAETSARWRQTVFVCFIEVLMIRRKTLLTCELFIIYFFLSKSLWILYHIKHYNKKLK